MYSSSRFFSLFIDATVGDILNFGMDMAWNEGIVAHLNTQGTGYDPLHYSNPTNIYANVKYNVSGHVTNRLTTITFGMAGGWVTVA